MTNRKLNLDDLIQKGIHSAARKIDLPPKEETWEQIVRELNHQRMIRRRNTFRTVATAALLLFSSFLIINPGNEATATGQRLVRVYEKIIGSENRTEMVSNRQAPKPNQPPPPIEQAPVKVIETSKPKIFKSIEEARKGVPFTFQAPKYIPEKYSIFNITFNGSETDLGEVAIAYRDSNAEIVIFEQYVGDDFALSENFEVPETKTATVNINGINGKLRSFKNGYNELEYYSQGLVIRVGGHTISEELVKIGKSI